jgi:phage-related holin
LLVFGDIPGDKLVNFILLKFPDSYLILVLIVLIVIGLLAFLVEKIGNFDLNLGYGRIIKKLKVLITDMNALTA